MTIETELAEPRTKAGRALLDDERNPFSPEPPHYMSMEEGILAIEAEAALDVERHWEELLQRFDKECEDALNTGIRPLGGDELKAWNYVVKHFRQVFPLIVSEHRANTTYTGKET